MKNNILHSLLLLSLLLLTGCYERRVLNNIDGTWRITSVRYSGGDLKHDSIVDYQNKNKFMVYEKCAIQENKSSPNNCLVSLQEASVSTPFTYQVFNTDGHKGLTIYFFPNNIPQDSMDVYRYRAKDWIGTYSVITLNDDKLIIRCDEAQVTNVSYLNPYSMREITAVR